MAIFNEEYRVVALEHHRLTVRGVCTGTVLVINADPDINLTSEDFPVGKLIALSDLPLRYRTDETQLIRTCPREPAFQFAKQETSHAPLESWDI